MMPPLDYCCGRVNRVESRTTLAIDLSLLALNIPCLSCLSCSTEAETAKTTVMQTDAKYQGLKGQRHQLFMDAFETVASE